MNRSFFFTIAFISCFFSYASAQFSNSGNSSLAIDDNKDWNTVFVEWNPSKLFMYEWDINGFTIGFSHAFSLTSNTPLYLEPAIAAQCFVQYSNNDYGLVFASIKVPVNLLYRLNIPNSKMSFMPFAGLYLRYNVWGNHNMFDYCKRFQVGGQAGIKAGFGNHFIIGASYVSDFNDIRYERLQSVNVSLGIAF